MIENSKKQLLRLFTAVALAAAGCSVTASGEIPCVDDSSCPSDYPVCSAGKCITGTSTAAESVAIVGVEGHSASDLLSGSITVEVTARAASGISAVTLTAGSKTYQPNKSSSPPLYFFDIPTTDLANADVSLTASVTGGDGTTASSTAFTVHIDNQAPTLSIALVGGAEIADGAMVKFDVTASKVLSSLTGTVSGSGSGPLGEISPATGLVHHFGYAVTSADAAGAHNVTFTAVDLARNSTSSTMSNAFNVHHPFISVSLTITTAISPVAGFPAAKTGTVVTVNLALPNTVVFASGVTPVFKLTSATGGSTRTLTAPTKTAGSPNDTWTSSYTVVTGDNDGLATISADSTDISGNVAPTQTGTLFIDQTRPVMASIASNKAFVLNGQSLTITGVATERVKTATISVSNGDTGTCTCDGVSCATDTSDTPVISCGVTITHGGSVSALVTATVGLTDQVGNASANIAANQAQYTVEPAVGLSGSAFSVTYSQNGVSKITGGSTAGHLIFNIPTITGGTATITDSFGNSYFDGATILGASGSTLNGAVPSTVATDSYVIPYHLIITNPAASIQQDASMTVVPAPAVTSFSASPLAVTNGAATQLIATFTGGTGVVTGTNGFTPIAIISGTPLPVTPASNLTTTYTLTVSNTAGDSAGTVIFGTTASVQAVASPSVGTGFAVTNVGAGSSGTSTITGSSSAGTLTFAVPTITGGTDATITDNNGVSVKDKTSGLPVTAVAILAAAGGNLTNVALPATAATDSSALTYTLTVTTPSGSVTTKTTVLTVVPKPVISGFSASAATVTNGSNNVTFSAAFTGGTAQLSGNNGFVSTAIVSGTPLAVTAPSSVTTGFKVTVTNAAADAAGIVQSSTVNVQSVATPSITAGSLTVSNVGSGSSGSSTITGSSVSGTLTFGIPTLGASVTSVTLTDDTGAGVKDNTSGNPVGSAAILAASGGTLTNVRLPTTSATDSGFLTYTLTLSNAAGASISTTVLLTVVPKPVISGFTASAATVTNGSNNVTLTASFSGGTGALSGNNGFVTVPIVSGTPLTVTAPSSVTTGFKVTVTDTAADTAGIVQSSTVNVQSVAAPSITTGSLTVSNVGAGSSGSSTITGTSASGTLTFGIPTLGAAVTSATLTDDTGAGVKDNTSGNPVASAAIIAASNGSLTNVRLPTTAAADSNKLTYTLTLSNAAGASISTTVQITVVPKPVISGFTASAATVTNGSNNVTLTASFSGGTGALSGNNGFVTVPIVSGTPLTVTAPSSVTTGFKVTVTDTAADTAGIVQSSTVNVQSVAAPSITAGTLTVSNVGSGSSGSSTITGSSVSGTLTFGIPTLGGTVTAATLTDNTGAGVKDNTSGNPVTSGAILAASNGSLTNVKLPTTLAADSNQLTYTLTLSNAAGASISTTVLLTVVPKPVISSLIASAATVTNGSNNVTFTASFSGGTGALSGNNGFVTVPIVSGTPLAVTAPSSVTTGFKVTVTDTAADTAGIVQSSTVNVQSVAAPSITAGTLTVTNAGGSLSSTITGSSASGTLTFGIPTLGGAVTSASLTDNSGAGVKDNTSGNPVSSGTILAASGSNLVNVRLPTTASTDSTKLTYTLTLSNAAGSTISTTVQVTVVPVPVIISFTAAATRVADGSNNTTLTAHFSGGTGVVSKDAFAGTTPIVNNTPLAVTSTADTTSTWQLRVTNAAGDTAGTVTFGTSIVVTAVGVATATGQLTVSPHVVGFGAGNGNLTFTAPTFGATVVSPGTITGGGFTATITSGGTVTTPTIPAPTSSTTYTLTLTNGVGSTLTQTATVLVSDVVSTPNLPTTQTNCTIAASAANCIGKFGVTATWLGGTSTRVLLAGGSSAAGCTGTIAPGWVLWDTATASVVTSGTGNFSQVAGRCGHTATLLANGKIAIAGGASSADTKRLHIDLFDPAGPSVSDDHSQLTTARCGHVAALATTGSNNVVIAGGTDCTAFPGGAALATVEIYVPSGSTNNEVTVTAPLNATRVNATATLLNNGNVLFAGGAAGATADVFALNGGTPANSTVSATTNSMQFVRSNHTATLLQSGKVLLVGGAGTNTGVDIYDSTVGANGSFSATVVNSVSARTSHGATLLPSGLVLIAGGLVSATPVFSTEMFDPGTTSFTNTTVIPLSVARSQFPLVNIGDLNFAFGGDGVAGQTIDVIATP